ncbi:MAG TPA: folate-binding protein [Pseudolabrys sp.]|jgi:folate-binding protein YgfZ|nr:folate-binding protein [Pseudolabrys sp.]
MQVALLPDRGVVKVAGDDARGFLNGLVTNDIAKVAPGKPRFAALLTPQGKIIVDFIVAEAPGNDGGGFFLDCPRALASALVEKLNFYKLRAKVICEDLSSVLGVMAIWDGTAESEYGLSYPDPRLPALGSRIMLPPHLAEEAAADLGGMLAGADAYEAHRIALGVPRGGLDFIYGDTFSHEADMDQLNGVDFGKGCYIGQEVVSRVEHRASARSRVVPIVYDEFAPSSGLPVMAGDRQIGTLGSTAKGHGLALMRLDRIGDALAAGATIEAGGIAIRAVKPAWAKFDWPGEAKAPA